MSVAEGREDELLPVKSCCTRNDNGKKERALPLLPEKSGALFFHCAAR